MTGIGPGSCVLGLGLGSALLIVLNACNETDPVVSGEQRHSQVARATAAPTAAPTQPVAALPRAVDTLTLAMARADVVAQIGDITCHDSDDGIEVCRPKDAARGRSELEVFFFRDAVVSIAYEVPPPPEVWSHLEALIHQYGKPSLNGMTQRDVRNRLHEIYGWRDTKTIYSTRFVWAESPPPRHVVTTVVTIWDRAAYAAWEDEKARRPITNGEL